MNENNHLYDCIVLGLGPAGISASVYLKRYGDDVIAIGLDGGSLKEAHVIDNFYGLFHQRGEDILKLGYEQAKALEIPLKFEEVVDIEILDHVVIKTNKDIYHGKKLFLALGRNRRRPNIKNLRSFEGKGVSYCATCDGFLYRNKRIAILGEGGELMREEYDVLKNFTKDLFVLTNGVKIDSNAIDKEISSIEGKDIVFEGPVSFKILPSPYLQASNVKIYNHLAKGEQPLVTIGKLSIDVSLQELINGNLYVTRMLLENPLVNIEINDEGKLNWERPLTQEQRQKLENSNIRLNSVSLANASVVVDYPSKAYNLRLDNLNGEIMTQTVLGPYRIEGNYMKGSTPEGFAISVGKLSESFPTTLDFALTHPLSNSYIRFDGNFQLSNKVFNGNIVLESQNLKRFVEDNFKDVGLADAYNYPLAMTFDINTTEQQINLANMVIKYGNSQGAGSAQIPIEDILNIGENSIKPRVAMAFNFTDLDLSPLVYTFNDFTKRYKNSGNIYNPDWPIDLQLDLKSLRTQYNNQPVKNFEASLDLIDNIINFNNVTAVLPGDTDFKLKGDLSSLDDQPFYNLELSFSSVDFSKLLSWFGYTPEVVVPSTYRKAEGGAKISGSVDKIFISPYSLTLDKSSFAGEAGLKLGGARKDMMLTINGDSVNFDNYIAEMPVEEKAKSWLERMKYRFNKLGFLNDFDMQLKTKLDLAIYNTIPFENIDLNVSLFDGKADIEKLNIGSVYNSKFEISGLLKGFGGVPGFENLKYHVTTADFQNLSEKLELKVPQVDYKKMKNFDGQGIMTGNFGKLAIESVSKLEKLEINYKGQVDNEKPNLMLDGDFEIKHPDFVTMLQDIGLKYNPQVYTMGLFDLKTKFIGSGNEFVARPLEFNIGYNKFSGSLDYDTAGERPNVFATLGINKFEIDKFFGTKKDVSQAPQINIANDDSENEFLAKPYWEKDVFDFAFLSKYNVSGDFSVDELTYKSHAFEKASMSVALVNDNLAINNFSARYNGGDLKGNFTLNAAENPNVSGSASFVGTEVNNLGIGGKKYALKEGKYNSEVTFNGNFSSFDDFIKNLKASVKFSIKPSLGCSLWSAIVLFSVSLSLTKARSVITLSSAQLSVIKACSSISLSSVLSFIKGFPIVLFVSFSIFSPFWVLSTFVSAFTLAKLVSSILVAFRRSSIFV